jgi:hypothetical protein
MADEPTPEVATPRGRKFVRLFLMAAGGLAAPCLALAAFFLSSGADDPPPAKSAAVQGGRVTATTAPARTAPTTAAPTTTTIPALPSAPARDPFLPLVTPPTAGGTPAR